MKLVVPCSTRHRLVLFMVKGQGIRMNASQPEWLIADNRRLVPT